MHFRAKHDREMIAAWEMDLDRIHKVFNVCSVVSARLLLIFRTQAELIMLWVEVWEAEFRGEGILEGCNPTISGRKRRLPDL